MTDRARQCIVCGIGLAGRHAKTKLCSDACRLEWRRQQLNPRYANAARARRRNNYWADPEKHRERTRAWRAKNPDKAKESYKDWAEKNPEKVQAARRRNYVKNREARIAYARDRRAANPEMIREQQENFRQRNRTKIREQARIREQNERIILQAVRDLELV